VLAGSITLHGVVLAFLALPRIAAFPDRSDDEDALTVTLERIETASRTKASPAAASALGAVQPRLPRAVFRSAVAPLGLPGAPPATAAGPGSADHPAPLPAGAQGSLKSALRGSAVGCANPAGLGLNRREVEHCDERWGAAARNAPVYANTPHSAAATAEFDRQAAAQEADRRYRDEPMGLGVNHRDHGGPGQAKDIPFVMGDTDGIGRKKSDQSLGIKRGH
jgi:hypothetical protein